MVLRKVVRLGVALQPNAMQVCAQRDQLDGGWQAAAAGEVHGVVLVLQQPGVQAACKDGHADDRPAHEAVEGVITGAARLVAAMWHSRGDDYVARVAGLKITSVEDHDDVDRVLGREPGAGEIDGGMVGQVGARSLRSGIVAAIPVLHGIGEYERARRLHRGSFALAPAKQQQGRRRGSDGTRAQHAPMLVQFWIVGRAKEGKKRRE